MRAGSADMTYQRQRYMLFFYAIICQSASSRFSRAVCFRAICFAAFFAIFRHAPFFITRFDIADDHVVSASRYATPFTMPYASPAENHAPHIVAAPALRRRLALPCCFRDTAMPLFAAATLPLFSRYFAAIRYYAAAV